MGETVSKGVDSCDNAGLCEIELRLLVAIVAVDVIEDSCEEDRADVCGF